MDLGWIILEWATWGNQNGGSEKLWKMRFIVREEASLKISKTEIVEGSIFVHKCSSMRADYSEIVFLCADERMWESIYFNIGFQKGRF